MKKMPKWQRDLNHLNRRRRVTTVTNVTVEKRLGRDGKISTFKSMAAYLDVDERTLRKAYAEDAFVRVHITKIGGRYHSDDIALESVHMYLMTRREAGPARALHATEQKRNSKGQF
jgi:hypothetical protein